MYEWEAYHAPALSSVVYKKAAYDAAAYYAAAFNVDAYIVAIPQRSCSQRDPFKGAAYNQDVYDVAAPTSWLPLTSLPPGPRMEPFV